MALWKTTSSFVSFLTQKSENFAKDEHPLAFGNYRPKRQLDTEKAGLEYMGAFPAHLDHKPPVHAHNTLPWRYHYSHSTHEETEAQKNEITCPKPYR